MKRLARHIFLLDGVGAAVSLISSAYVLPDEALADVPGGIRSAPPRRRPSPDE